MAEHRILSQRTPSIFARNRPGRLLAIAGLMAAGVVAAFGFAPEPTSVDAPSRFVTRDLALPALAPVASGDGYWREERIERGDTLGSLLARLSVVDPAAQQFLRTDASARALYQLRPGRTVRVKTDDDGRLLALRYLTQSDAVLAVDRAQAGFVASNVQPAYSVHLELRGGEIRSSLFGAADAEGLPDAVTMQLAVIF